MKNRLGALLVASVVPLVAATPTRAQTRWSTFAPAGEGFSIEVPGEPVPMGEPGHYVYGVNDWSFIIKVDPVSPTIRELVEARQREPLAWFLDRIGRGLTNHGKATVVSSSSADFEGYPSLLISLEDQGEGLVVEGIDRLVLTEEHLYMLITVGRKGSPRADAERFLGSFRLVKTASAPTASRPSAEPALTNPLVAKMAGPMLIVTRLITEQHMNPRIDHVVQNVPAAERLGNQWNPSNTEWQRARTVISDRVARMFGMYETSGELERTLESELASVAPGSDADALTAALNGPAGGAILRNCAVIQFVSTIMAEDPNGPKAGEHAWGEKMRALKKVFDERAGSAMPPDDGTHAADLSQYMAGSAHRVSMDLWSSVVGKATTQLDGAINLMIFDDRENILREIEAAIAGAK
jgi:hypothetical protein